MLGKQVYEVPQLFTSDEGITPASIKKPSYKTGIQQQTVSREYLGPYTKHQGLVNILGHTPNTKDKNIVFLDVCDSCTQLNALLENYIYKFVIVL